MEVEGKDNLNIFEKLHGVRKALIFILIFLFISLSVYSQYIGSHTSIYGIEEGLSQSSINHILIDSKGYLWLATCDGLNRYDGNSFLVFKHIPNDSNSLCDNYIRSICEDKDGDLWIATSNGLSCYIRKEGIFKNYYHDSEDPHSLSSNNIFHVLQDRKGILWIKTIETIDRLVPNTNKFIHYYHYNNVFNYASSDFFFDLFEDSHNKLWVGTKDGLNCFDRNFELFQRYESDPFDTKTISDNRIKAICEDKNGNIWVGTENGLNCFDRYNKTFTRYFNHPGNKNSLIDNSVNCLYVDKNGILWIGTMKGFCSFDIDKKLFIQYPNIILRNIQYSLTGISSIVIDGANNMWIGCYEGLVKIDLKPFKFGLLGHENQKFVYNVTAILSDNNQNLWVGTRNNGLFLINHHYRNNEIIQTSAFSGIKKEIYALFKDKNSNIWIGTNDGILLYNDKTKKLSQLSTLNYVSDFLENNKIYSFHEDKRGIIWIASEYGLHLYDPQKQKFSLNIQLPDSQGITIKLSRCFVEDKNGYIWIGTDDGLIKFNYENKDYKKYFSHPRGSVRSLPSNSVYSLLYTKDNKIWVGTNAGFCLYNPTSDDFTVYTERDGLPNNTIYSMIDDEAGNIWMSTNKGLICFDTKLEYFTSFDLADGLQGYEFNLGSSAKSSNGEIFFGGIHGLNYFFPDSLQPNSFTPNTEVTQIELISKGIKRIYALWSGKEIRIPANTKLFTIYFASLDLTLPSNNKYMYKLSSRVHEGLWINNGSKNFVQFSNLSPGKYIFQVKGSNSDQIWSKEPYVLIIIVETPFYKSRVAIVLYVILVLIIGYTIVRVRTIELVRTNKELQERNAASEEIKRQKEELSIKNKNITDSINYAKRLQDAMIPSEKVFRRHLPNSFVFFKPKDIVSGDFYWIHSKNDKVLVAVVDCTGHGVPGAFMSIIGIELLRSISVRNIDDPSLILKQIADDFIRIFGDMEDVGMKDGMDVALCVIDKTKSVLMFSGAVHPLYLIRDNKITEFDGDRYSISLENKNEDVSFTTHTIQLQKDDMVYVFSDGFADQFGGPEGKKFKYRRFRHLLLNIHKMPLEDQKNYLDETIATWMGNYEQVDDLMVIGIRGNFE